VNLLVVQPAASAKPRYHEAHGTAIYMLGGVTEFQHAPNLEFKDRVEAVDYVYISAVVLHQQTHPSIDHED
jgi:uncharacterized RmlC-like cupin family protein